MREKFALHSILVYALQVLNGFRHLYLESSFVLLILTINVIKAALTNMCKAQFLATGSVPFVENDTSKATIKRAATAVEGHVFNGNRKLKYRQS